MGASKGKNRASGRKARNSISASRLAEMIEEATVDAYDECEQATGWFTVLEEHLALPFETDMLGVRVVVEGIDLREDNRIIAVCRRGKNRQAVALGDLPLPTPKPAGGEWVEAYRHWLGGL